MVKVVLEPKDEHFEQNVTQLRRCKSLQRIDVVVDGRAVACEDVRVKANGRFGYTRRSGFGEFRVNMSAVTRVTFYLEVK